MNENRLFHIDIPSNFKAKYALLTGDPGRVPNIAKQFLENPQFIAQKREFTSWCGTISGEKVIVCSTGIGGPSAAICIEELAKTGVETFIRIGTSGAMQKHILPGELVIATGAVRMEGTSKEYMPIEFPAVADFDVTSALCKACMENSVKYHTGIVQSKDSFYGQHSPHSMPVKNMLEDNWNAWIAGGVLASEMECAALFTVASVRKCRAGAVLDCIWNQEANADYSKNKQDDLSHAFDVAVDALKLLIEKK